MKETIRAIKVRTPQVSTKTPQRFVRGVRRSSSSVPHRYAEVMLGMMAEMQAAES